MIVFLVGCGGKKTDVSSSVSLEEKPNATPPKIEEVIEDYTPPQAVFDASKLQTIYFDFDVFTLSKPMLKIVNENIAILKEYPEVKIKLEGNTDAYGSDEYNFALGTKRALSVRDALVVAGIDKSRITFVSFGETNPVCLEMSAECRAKNRRVNFVVEGQ
ncbi:hypothetical protein BBW65_06480 [Helicobacter enhydrae]|uniref:OmpA-like domain-containing protein n=2 Tax=Helicobacter enhydrae TaxID=222136 RepID=A0A1B1U6P3_9HELI|nr:hypothetical protein BBW65_06480 [Helicobacter enhydrae]